jgi:hypothetical protein
MTMFATAARVPVSSVSPAPELPNPALAHNMATNTLAGSSQPSTV